MTIITVDKPSKVFGSAYPSNGGKKQRTVLLFAISCDSYRHAAIIKSRCEETIIATNSASGSRRLAIGIEDFADVNSLAISTIVLPVSPLRIAQRRSIDADRVAVMAQAAQQGFDHGCVATAAPHFPDSEVRITQFEGK